MSNVHQDTEMTLMITAQDHAAAQAFYACHQDTQKGRQVYLNTLAVRVVERYLKYFGIQADLSESVSYDVITQQLLNTAALHIPNIGDVECRPVLAEATSVYVPEEVQSDRLGYVAVQLNSALDSACLLGFLAKASQVQVPLNALEPLDALLDTLEQASLMVEANPSEFVDPFTWEGPIPIKEWFTRKVTELVNTGWQTLEALESLVAPEARMELAYQVRGAVATARGKLVDVEKGKEHVVLVVGFQEPEPPKTKISVEVYPTGTHIYLPKDLELMVLDETGIAVMQAQARSNKKIQMDFSGKSGEEFSVKLAMGEFSMTEAFRI